ncbi:MAG: isoprenylcysteine carboxylmethyltransferase family protein [Roseiflexaceae bacterium]
MVDIHVLRRGALSLVASTCLATDRWRAHSGVLFLFFLTFRKNAYLSPVVRIQDDRGHTVVSTGPYQYVRHPMYAAILIFVVGTSLVLGSGYGVLFGLVLVGMVARWAVLEERTLRQELRGYAAYMAQVHYRIIPYVW